MPNSWCLRLLSCRQKPIGHFSLFPRAFSMEQWLEVLVWCLFACKTVCVCVCVVYHSLFLKVVHAGLQSHELVVSVHIRVCACISLCLCTYMYVLVYLCVCVCISWSWCLWYRESTGFSMLKYHWHHSCYNELCVCGWVDVHVRSSMTCWLYL